MRVKVHGRPAAASGERGRTHWQEAEGACRRGGPGGTAQLVQCSLCEVRVRGNGLGKGQVVVVRLAEVVACRRRKQASAGEPVKSGELLPVTGRNL